MCRSQQSMTHSYGTIGAHLTAIRAAKGEKIRKGLQECPVNWRIVPVQDANETAQSTHLSVESCLTLESGDAPAVNLSNSQSPRCGLALKAVTYSKESKFESFSVQWHSTVGLVSRQPWSAKMHELNSLACDSSSSRLPGSGEFCLATAPRCGQSTVE